MSVSNNIVSGVSGRVFRWVMLIMLTSLSILSSCSTADVDDARTKPPSNKLDAEVLFEINLPQSQAPSTYAISREKEDSVKSIEILLFKIEGANKTYTGKPYYCDVIDTDKGASSNKKRFTISLPKGGPYDIVILANSRDIVKDALVTVVPTVSEKKDVLKLLTLQHNDKWISDVNTVGFAPFPMWGELSNKVISENLMFNTSLTRMLAKIDVALTTQKAKDNFKLQEIYLVNPNTEGHLVPAEDNFEGGKPTKPTLVSGSTTSPPLHYTSAEASIVNEEFKGVIYTFEATKAVAGSLPAATCLVLKGTYAADGQVYYYRIDFGSRDLGTRTLEYLDILRNMEYIVNISSVYGPGRNSVTEAINNPSANINADIVIWDHNELPIVVFDSQNTLGFSRDEIVVSFKESHDNQIKVRTDYSKGWKVDKIVDAQNVAVGWLSLPVTSGAANITANLQFDFLENPDLTPRVCYVYFSAGDLTHIVKVTQLAAIRIRSIVWDDYDGISDGDTKLTTLVVEQLDGTKLASTITAGGVVNPVMALETLSKVTVIYMGYVYEVPVAKYLVDTPTEKITVYDRRLIGKPVHLDKIRLDLTGDYLQIADIDLATYSNAETGTPEGNWVPIGINTPVEAQFSGSYDGGSGNGGAGFTISNLKIERETTNYIGLFGYASATSVLTKIHIATGSSIKGQSFVGGIAGQGATITSCTNNAVIKGDGNLIGGICGYQLGTPATSIIRDCKNLAGGSITAGATSLQVGGIAGNSTGTISACTNAVPVTAPSHVGGICGVSTGAIENCNNTVAVEATAATSYVGGIAGQGATITGCTNNATITGAGNCIGGICGGQTGTPATSIIRDCKNLAGGIITVGASSQQVGGIAGNSTGMILACSNAVPISGATNVGGIVGYSLNNGVVEDCHNTVTVTGTTGNNTGGIVGWGKTIIDCSNSAVITGLNNVGGICGTGVIVSGCTNTALVTGVTIVGGICGGGSSVMKDCTNSGNVKGTGTNIGGIVGSKGLSLGISNCHNSSQTVITEKGNAGGIAGSSSESPVTNCTNTASVTGTSYTGGICGYATGAVTACWNKGNIVGVGGRSTVGGIVGYNIASIVACYNIASVTASANAGAIHGTTSPGTVTDCYYGETSPATGPGTKFGEDPNWPTEATPGWEEYPANPLGAWTDLGSWNGGINPSYPTLK